MDWRVPKFEIGYWLSSADVGYGYMTEAVRSVTQITFEDLKARRIEIHTDLHNHRSRKVAERAGYALEGVLKNECRDQFGLLRDTCLHASAR